MFKMKRALITLIISAVVLSFLPAYAGTDGMTGNGAVKVPVLVYHSIRKFYKSDTDFIKRFVVPPIALDIELHYLKNNNYTSISFDNLVNYFTKRTPLPPKPVILTFDDGWENQYQNAFPLLKKYGFTATFFIFTNAINKKHFLTWAEIKEMDKAGMTIGGHTRSHPYLYIITDPARLRDEIIGGKKIIEANLGHPISAFAAPYGSTNDQIGAITKEAGFTTLRTENNGIYHTKDSLFMLKGNEVTGDFKKFMSVLHLNN